MTAANTMTEEKPATPGRPRSPEADRKIQAATIQALREQGYSAMSIETVAALAGVGRATIYRRYVNKLELVVDAVTSVLQPHTEVDTGSTLEDILALMKEVEHQFIANRGIRLALMFGFEGENHPELLAIVRERLIGPRRAGTIKVLQRGIKRGEVRADLDVEIASDILGGMVFGLFYSGRKPPKGWYKQSTQMYWDGVKAG